MTAARSKTTRTLATLAFVAFASLGSFAAGRRSARSSATSAAAAPITVSDPVLLAPASTRVVFAADIARLRSASAIAPLLARYTADPRTCSAIVLSRAQRVIAFARDATLEDLAFVFEGPIQRDELAQCLAQPDVRPAQEQHAGVALTVLRRERASGLLPAADPTALAALPGALLLAGPEASVRAMIDRAARPVSSTRAALSPALSTLSERLEAGNSVALASLVTPRVGQWSSVLAHVEGVAIGARARDSLRVEALLACDDFDSPRAVADGLSRARDDLQQQMDLAPLRTLLGRAVIERRATDVRVTIELGADDLALGALALQTMLSREEAPPPPTTLAAGDAGGD